MKYRRIICIRIRTVAKQTRLGAKFLMFSRSLNTAQRNVNTVIDDDNFRRKILESSWLGRRHVFRRRDFTQLEHLRERLFWLRGRRREKKIATCRLANSRINLNLHRCTFLLLDANETRVEKFIAVVVLTAYCYKYRKDFRDFAVAVFFPISEALKSGKKT